MSETAGRLSAEGAFPTFEPLHQAMEESRKRERAEFEAAWATWEVGPEVAAQKEAVFVGFQEGLAYGLRLASDRVDELEAQARADERSRCAEELKAMADQWSIHAADMIRYRWTEPTVDQARTREAALRDAACALRTGAERGGDGGS